MTVSNKPGHRGEREVSRKTIAQGRPAGSGVPVVTTLVCLVLFRTRGCGCIGHPAFPAPSVYRGANGSCKNSGGSRRENAGSSLEVGAMSLRGATRPPELNERPRPPKLAERRRKVEATKQSILPLRGAMDCFAEPVIGRAFARPVGSQ